MYIKIWRPGTDLELDQQFEDLRYKQYRDRSHPLWKNYTQSTFKECTALSITFNNDQPVICSSILTRDCWPKDVYRIMNSTWKCNNRRVLLQRHTTLEMSTTVSEHLKWLEDHIDFKLAFISRESSNWRSFFLQDMIERHGCTFKTTDSKYLTCDNINDQSCWQYIAYWGDDSVLSRWSSHD
jgi:hypothetical protein